MTRVLALCVFAALVQQPAPVFRAETSLVPLDIRVLDRNGKPIAGLKASDFTILENNAPQTISHFSPVTLAADPPPVDAAPLRRSVPDETAPLTPQTRRVFLIVFGRGRLQHPSMGVDAAMSFVRERLLPRDQVALMAYNRATDFTTDREQAAALIERFRTRHEHIEAMLQSYFHGWSAMYKGLMLPPEIQSEIDDVFDGPLATRKLAPGYKADGTRIEADSRRIAQDLQRAEILKDRAVALASIGVAPNQGDAADIELASMAGMTLPEFVSANRQSVQDLDGLYAGIQYLRFIEGEKHLVFITQQGLNLPRLESDMSVAAAANQARVAIDIIQTGGHRSTMVPAFRVTAGEPTYIPSVTQGEPIVQRFIIRSLRSISELTGGQVSVYEQASTAFDRIERASSSWYLLGYYPSNRLLDGKYRRVSVKVNRPGATVLYRHGYFAEPRRAPIDQRRAMSYSRVASAANYPAEIRDLPFSLKTSQVRGQGKVPDLVVELTIDASAVAFTELDGRRIASLDIAVFGQDQEGDAGGDLWQTMDLKLLPESHARMLKDGITYTGRISASKLIKFVKVIVYDVGADRVGTLTRQVR